MSSKVYFVTGAGRGHGLSLTKQLLSLPNTTVVGPVRHILKDSELSQIAKTNKNLHIVTLDTGDEASFATLDAQLSALNIDGIDYLVSNAAIGGPENFIPILESTAEIYKNHYQVNVVGPFLLAKTLYPYLKKRETRVMYFVTSIVGSIGGFAPTKISAYSNSKAALNQLTRQFADELTDEGFIVVCVHPGGVDTDMMRSSIHTITDPDVLAHLRKMTLTPETSARKQVELMNRLTKEDNSKFFQYDGSEIPW